MPKIESIFFVRVVYTLILHEYYNKKKDKKKENLQIDEIIIINYLHVIKSPESKGEQS